MRESAASSYKKAANARTAQKRRSVGHMLIPNMPRNKKTWLTWLSSGFCPNARACAHKAWVLPTATNGLGYQAETKGLDGKIYQNKTVKLYPTWQTVAQENWIFSGKWQVEFGFYLVDLHVVLTLVHRGSFDRNWLSMRYMAILAWITNGTIIVRPNQCPQNILI